MSRPFEQKLAEWYNGCIDQLNIEPDDRYAAQFSSGQTASEVCEAILDEAGPKQSTKTIEYENERQDIPVLTINGTPLFTVAVRRSGDDVSEHYEVSKYYASTLRNIVSRDTGDGEDAALLLIQEEGAGIETLDTVSKLFDDKDSEFPLYQFQDWILDQTEELDAPGQALMGVVEEELGLTQVDPTNDLEPLRIYCEFYTNCIDEKSDQLPDIISKLGTYLKETWFIGGEDREGTSWFDKTGDVDDLEKQIYDVLKNNRKHAKRISEADRVGKDAESELKAYYSPEFIEDVVTRHNWQNISRAEAEDGELDDEDTDVGTGSGKGKSGSDGRPKQKTSTPKFKSITISQDDKKRYSPDESGGIERHIVAPIIDGSFSAEIEYSSDVSDEPIECVDSNGERHSSFYTVDEDSISVSFSGLDPEIPHYYSLKVYVGFKKRSGTPENEFRFALLPQWFFTAMEDDTYNVDVSNEALTASAETRISLTPENSHDKGRQDIDIDEKNRMVALSQPVLLRPNALANVDRLRCQIVESEDTPVPISIEFVTSGSKPTPETIRFPLFFEALVSPDDWANEDLLIESGVNTDLDTGRFQSVGRGQVKIQNADHQLLMYEEEIVRRGEIAPREVDQVEVGTGVTNTKGFELVSADLKDAYTRLFKHFTEREKIPSTDPWDPMTQDAVEDVLEAYVAAFKNLDKTASQTEYELYRELGTIQSTQANKTWLTPFHPLMLAYALRISQWRDSLADRGLTEGFQLRRFESLFTPVGLKPYRWNDQSGDINSGNALNNHHLWATYDSIKGTESTTPDYIANVVADKLRSFSKAFPLLLNLHTDRQIKINLINMGDAGAIIEGLYEFYGDLINDPDFNPPEITLQIYGGEGQGRSLERFFAPESANSELRDRLESRDSKRSDPIIDILDTKVTYIHAAKTFDDETREPAHLTFFRGVLEEKSGTLNANNFPTATRLDGLLPRDQIEVDPSTDRLRSKSAAAFDLDSGDLLHQVGAAVNALEASLHAKDLTPDRTLSKIISSTDQASLPNIWEDSLWVLHVEPKVGVDFYIKSKLSSEDTLMIHYSDQYDAASPGFDVITTTNKRDPYIEALQKALDQEAGLDEVNAEAVLTRLVAIDGEMALDIQRDDGNSPMELLGLIGGLAVSSILLARTIPEYEWIPINLAEFARHDRKYRDTDEGLLQYFLDGQASDDLCFVGLPTEDATEDLSIKLWLVETKGGSSGVSKGVQQIDGARDNLEQLFNPDQGYADTEILRSEFADVVLRIANRLYNHGLLEQNRLEQIEQYSDNLIDANYSIDFLKDSKDNIGEVIRIQKTRAIPNIRYKNNVRIIELPVDVLKHINDRPEWGETIHPDLDEDQLSFDPDNYTRMVSTEVSATDPASSDPVIKSSNQIGSDEAADVEGGNSNEESSVDDHSPTETAADPETLDEKTTVEGEKSPTESQPEDENAPQSELPADEEDAPDSKRNDSDSYTWSNTDFDSLTKSLSQSPKTDLEMDVSNLTDRLKQQFESLGVDIHQPNPADVSFGPRKIGVNIRPKSGQKIESVLNSLDSVSVHIGASGTITGIPNPSEGAIRLEIPHDEPEAIHVRDAFATNGTQLCEPLHIPLGVSTERNHHTLNLLDEHHVLIGGATGSGKSNFLSTCICSLAVCHPPERVRLSLLDPKGIDFGRFESLPQVDEYIDTPQKCVEYLRDLIDNELEHRRQELREKGVASVQEYNQLAAGGDFSPIPYRIIVIDEFADLIMSLSDSQNEFEETVSRLAQIGRALGYSILLATQRPDANIVSGNIKTNFNCRISFELPSQTDSRVILDQSGAEDLAGSGDLIVLTSAGDEYHLQSYLLPPEDAIEIQDRLE